MVFVGRKIALFLVLAVSAFGASEQVEVVANDFFADEIKQISILSGGVKIKKGAYDTLNSDRVEIRFNDKREPTKYIATGNANFKVLVGGKHYDGKGGILTYDPIAETYMLENNAYLHESETKKEVFGDKIIVNRLKGTYEVKGGGTDKKPVRLIFQVEDNKK